MKADKITFSDFRRWVRSLIRKIDFVDIPELKGYPYREIKNYLEEISKMKMIVKPLEKSQEDYEKEWSQGGIKASDYNIIPGKKGEIE